MVDLETQIKNYMGHIQFELIRANAIIENLQNQVNELQKQLADKAE